MSGQWDTLIWLGVTLGALILLKRLLNGHLQGAVLLVAGSRESALFVFFLLLLPGVLLHEVSHWLMAKLLGVKTRGFSIGPKAVRGSKQVQFGAVRIANTDPVRESLIGLAPLLCGTALILYLAQRYLGIEVLGPIQASTLPEQITSYLRAPDAALWIYLIFAISNAMLPSQSDRKRWGTLGIYAAALVLIFYFVGGIREVPDPVMGAGVRVVSYLTWAFGLTVIVDLFVLVLIFLFEGLVALILRRRVDYTR